MMQGMPQAAQMMQQFNPMQQMNPGAQQQ